MIAMGDLSLSDVVFDQEIYPRAEWSQATANRYAEAIHAGGEFPPIILEEGTNRLLDGMHRWQAHKQAQRDRIAVVWQAIPAGVPPKLYAASLSTTHGDRIKGEELKAIAREIITGNPDYSMVTVAKYCGVTRQTVGKWVGDITERRRSVRKVQSLLLDRLDWTQVQIADLLGIKQPTVNDDLSEMSELTSPIGEDLLRDACDGLLTVIEEREIPEDPNRLLAVVDEIREERIFATWTDDERALLKCLRDGETIVVNLRQDGHGNLVSWAETAGMYVRIDRRSDWGNPFETPADGDRDTVIRNYAKHYLAHKPSLLKRIPELRGKALGCWCAPQACHGDILKARAEA